MNKREYYQYAKELAILQLNQDIKTLSKQETLIYASQFARETIKPVLRDGENIDDLPPDKTMKKINDLITAFVSMLKPIKQV